MLLNQTMLSDLIFISVDVTFSISASTLIVTNLVCNISKTSFSHACEENNCVQPLSCQTYQLIYQTKYNLFFSIGFPEIQARWE